MQSEGQARRAAQRIGFPAVTKPYEGNHGRGISIRLTTPDEVAAGFAAAREHARSVIVESFVEGDDHRLLVVNGDLVAATKRTPGHVVGDGVHTVAALVDIMNQDPRRGVGHEKVLTRLELDAQALAMLEKAHLRGRAPGEVPRIFRETLLAAGSPESAAPVAASKLDAAALALGWARPGDVLALLVHSAAARAALLERLEESPSRGAR